VQRIIFLSCLPELLDLIGQRSRDSRDELVVNDLCHGSLRDLRTKFRATRKILYPCPTYVHVGMSFSDEDRAFLAEPHLHFDRDVHVRIKPGRNVQTEWNRDGNDRIPQLHVDSVTTGRKVSASLELLAQGLLIISVSMITSPWMEPVWQSDWSTFTVTALISLSTSRVAATSIAFQ